MTDGPPTEHYRLAEIRRYLTALGYPPSPEEEEPYDVIDQMSQLVADYAALQHRLFYAISGLMQQTSGKPRLDLKLEELAMEYEQEKEKEND